MEEFLAKYGLRSEQELNEIIKSDAIFAIKVVDDLLAEKFPKEALTPTDVAAEEIASAPAV
jgi:hypothetical protein